MPTISGVENADKMLQALTNGLDDVAEVTPDYKAATRSDHEGAIRLDKLDIPQPDQGLETGINDVEIALGELGAANQDYQVVQLKDDLRTIAKEDDKAEARLKDIETTKQLLSNVGGMIDKTVRVMKGGGQRHRCRGGPCSRGRSEARRLRPTAGHDGRRQDAVRDSVRELR